jgi:hypothetical protein
MFLAHMIFEPTALLIAFGLGVFVGVAAMRVRMSQR